jgi:hypothetical protein
MIMNITRKDGKYQFYSLYINNLSFNPQKNITLIPVFISILCKITLIMLKVYFMHYYVKGSITYRSSEWLFPK